MASEVEIYNLALSNIRGGSVNSLTEPSLQRQVCSLKYPILRDRLLRELPWQFNRKIVALAELTTEVFNWAYAYQYPTDCLKIHRIIGAYEELPRADAGVINRLIDTQVLPIRDVRRQVSYEVFNFSDNRVIGANESDLRIDYAAKVTDPNLFSDDFIMALSHLLASEIAIPIIGVDQGRQLRSDSLQMYNEYLESAMAADMNDEYLEPRESDFVTVRR